MLSVKHLTLRFCLSLGCALALLGWTHAAAAQRRLVLAGGGFQDLTPIVYNGNRPRPPGSGPAPVGTQRNTVEIFQKIIALAGGAKNIGVLTTASDATSARDNGTYYVDVLRYLGAGAGTVWIPVRIANNGSCAVSNSDPALVAQINAMDGFFFGGGDQSRILTCFFKGSGSSRTDSPIMAALRARYQAGAVVAGTSAGTSVQSGSPMVTGGESYYGLRYGVYTSLGSSTTVPTRDNNDPGVTTTNYFDRLAYDAVGGLGFFTEGLIDSHFSERGRQGRMIRLAWSRFINFGYGVDENTALVVDNAGTSSAVMSVVGQNGVFIFDLSQASSSVAGPGSTQACSSARGFKLCYVRAHYATPGDTYAPATRTFSTAKPAIVGSGSLATRPFPEDIFSSPDNTGSSGRVNPRQFASYAGSLFRSSATRADQLSFEGLGETRFRVCLEKSSAAGSAGYASTASAAVTGFRDLLIDVVPSTSACP